MTNAIDEMARAVAAADGTRIRLADPGLWLTASTLPQKLKTAITATMWNPMSALTRSLILTVA